MPATLRSRLPAVILGLEGETDEAVKEGAEAIAEAARDRVPVDSGTLRDAIHVEETEVGYSVTAGDTDAFYGHMVEFGTKNSPAHPFLIPAYEAEKERLLEGIEDALEDL